MALISSGQYARKYEICYYDQMKHKISCKNDPNEQKDICRFSKEAVRRDFSKIREAIIDESDNKEGFVLREVGHDFED